ncbi:MAG: hypothetical protein R2774_00220 [Saprospiraceae bacterium]
MGLWSSLDILDRLKDAVRKYPVSLIFTTITAITFICTVNNNNSNTLYLKLGFSTYVGFLVSMLMYIGTENYRKNSSLTHVITFIVSLLSAFLIYWILPEKFGDTFCNISNYIAIIVVLHLLFLSHIVTGKKESVHFLYHSFSGFFIWLQGVFFSLVLYVALSLVLVSLKYLFDLDVGAIRHLQLFYLLAFIVHPILFLSDYGELSEIGEIKEPSIIFEKFIQYIAVPVVFIFGILLYAYILRILVTDHNLAEWFSILVLWYFGSGIFTWLSSMYLLQFKEIKFLQWFTRLFPKISIPIVLFLFFANWKNIHQYWLKEEFYFIAFFGVFVVVFLIISNVFIRKIYSLPYVAIILVLIMLLGPWSICKVPLENAKKVFIQRLQENGYLKNNILTSIHIDFSSDDRLFGTYNYLSKRNELSFLKEYDQNGVISDSIDIYSLQSLFIGTKPNDSFVFGESEVVSSLDVAGFKAIYPIQYREFQAESIFVVHNDTDLIMKNGDAIICKFTISDILVKMHKDNLTSSDIFVCDSKEMRFRPVRADVHYKNNRLIIDNLTGYLLIK